jgi:hypothetical protein
MIIVSGVGSNSFALDDKKISEDEKGELIKLVCERLEVVYAFPESIPKICGTLTGNFEEGKYSELNTPGDFANRLNSDFEEITNDKHFGIVHDPKMAAEMKGEESEDEEESYLTAQMVEEERLNNFGFKELKILDGNIGYMDLRIFFPPKYAGETTVAAMSYFSNCDALIIDLRNNGGGWDDMVVFLMSYFFDTEEAVLFSTTYSRYENEYYQSQTMPYVPGKLLAGIPLYVLTSKSSFSAAEAFAYYMKHLDKAKIVGVRTRGGQNPVEIQTIGDGFVMYIPSWKLLYSATGSGWEGVGVEPDIEVEAAQALNAAHLDALKTLAEKVTDENEKRYYQWTIDGVKGRNNPAPVAEDIMQSYAGEYDGRTIYYENGDLYYRRGDRAKLRMTPVSEDFFLVDVYDYLRVKFIKEKGSVVGIEQIYNDGSSRKYLRE